MSRLRRSSDVLITPESKQPREVRAGSVAIMSLHQRNKIKNAGGNRKSQSKVMFYDLKLNYLEAVICIILKSTK